MTTSGALSVPRRASSSRSDSARSAPRSSHDPTTSLEAPSDSATRIAVARVAPGDGTPRASCARRRSLPGMAGTPARWSARGRVSATAAPIQPAGDPPGPSGGTTTTAPVGGGEGQEKGEGGRRHHAGSSIRAGGRAHACAAKALWTRKPSSS